eukprot:4576792-Lingulodinium_polyedra.AAC.1
MRRRGGPECGLVAALARGGERGEAHAAVVGGRASDLLDRDGPAAQRLGGGGRRRGGGWWG